MVRLAVLYDPFLLLRLQHELEEACIPYWVKNSQVQGLFGQLHYPNPALGPYEIWVDRGVEEEARNVLEAFFYEEVNPVCPYCNELLIDNVCICCEREE